MNKRGWTLVGELFAFLVVVILLIYAIYALNKLGLVRDMDEAIPGSKPTLTISGKHVNYDTVENNLVEASKKYVKDKFNDRFDDEVVIVRVSQLVKSGYISTIRDNKNKTCSGYVRVYSNGITNTYSPYLRCSQYISTGYEEEYDW